MEKTAIARALQLYLLIPIVALWAWHLGQRRYHEVVGRKRQASLFLTVLFIAVWIVSYLFTLFSVRDVFLIPVVLLAAGAAGWQRKLFLPFRLRCARCRRLLPLTRILFHDSEACAACAPPKRPEKETAQ